MQANGKFKWNSNMQGVILASYYYGYVLTPFASGVLAMKFGGKLPILVGKTSVAVLTLLTPILTTVGDFPALVVVRMLQGVGQVYPFSTAVVAYNDDSTSIRRPFDCLSKVIKVTMT